MERLVDMYFVDRSDCNFQFFLRGDRQHTKRYVFWPHQTQSLIITRITVWTVCGLSCFQRITDWTCSFTQGLWKERSLWNIMAFVYHKGIGLTFVFGKWFPETHAVDCLAQRRFVKKQWWPLLREPPALGTCVGSTSFWRRRNLTPKMLLLSLLAAVLLRLRLRLLLLLLKTTTKNYY